jgi:hypothetical protein
MLVFRHVLTFFKVYSSIVEMPILEISTTLLTVDVVIIFEAGML